MRIKTSTDNLGYLDVTATDDGRTFCAGSIAPRGEVIVGVYLNNVICNMKECRMSEIEDLSFDMRPPEGDRVFRPTLFMSVRQLEEHVASVTALLRAAKKDPRFN